MCLQSGGPCSGVTGDRLNDLKLGGHFSLHKGIIRQSDNILEDYSLIPCSFSFFFFSGSCKIAPLNAATHVWIIFLNNHYSIFIHTEVYF